MADVSSKPSFPLEKILEIDAPTYLALTGKDACEYTLHQVWSFDAAANKDGILTQFQQQVPATAEVVVGSHNFVMQYISKTGEGKLYGITGLALIPLKRP